MRILGIDPGYGITGFGIVDFPYMIELLRKHDFAGDMMLHGIYSEADMPGCLEYMKKCIGA